ncbi:hypothetical protein [Legionella clemsonensis]|uniref:Uncharacterized protein n=1 Tax=Legionella clemsonensis TaxID=1867846 RepID=A0A222P6C1_9GAMM|nr:hypothetical protein [Legionella clemsonensis]ASQ47396.1 hypothetical protein clem_14350 [Legionella clemsonensis]
MFTTFGIWEKEVRNLVNQLDARLSISSSDWMYTKGLLIFQSVQAEDYYKWLQNDTTGRVSAEFMTNLKIKGFQAVFKAFNLYAASQGELEGISEKEINHFIEVLGTNPELMICHALQAAATTELNDEKKLRSEQNQPMTPQEISAFVKQQFTLNQQNYKDNLSLVSRLSNQLTLMEEYSQYRRSISSGINSNSFVNSSANKNQSLDNKTVVSSTSNFRP